MERRLRLTGVKSVSRVRRMIRCLTRMAYPCGAGKRGTPHRFRTLFFILTLGGHSGMYRALYRTWRPQTFDDVCGQKQITDILKYQVSEGKISHAYLFCGSRGTGKTTCAKILAKAVNCLHPQNGNPCNRCEACRAIAPWTIRRPIRRMIRNGSVRRSIWRT